MMIPFLSKHKQVTQKRENLELSENRLSCEIERCLFLYQDVIAPWIAVLFNFDAQ